MEDYKKKLTGEERRKLGMEIFPPLDRLRLPESLRCERLREDVIKDIAKDKAMFERFQKLEPMDQEMLMGFFMGNRGLNILYDPFFKKIMTQERLERFLEQIMGQKIKIVRFMPTEDLQQSAEGSVMIMDMVVKLEDGSYIDLEVQRIAVEFPFERAVCYASDLVVRQYNQMKAEQKGKKFDYQEIRPVYVIVIMNSGTKKYRAFSNSYIHRTSDVVRFDTGLEERAIQKFIFITLDVFRRLLDNESKYKMTELEAWMTFLGSDKPDNISRLVHEYPEFKEIYQDINRFRLKPEEMMGMIGDAIRMLDEGDAKMLIDRLHSEVDQLIDEKDQLKVEKDQLKVEKDQLKEEKDQLKVENDQLKEEKDQLKDMLGEKDKEIAELCRLLAQSKS